MLRIWANKVEDEEKSLFFKASKEFDRYIGMIIIQNQIFCLYAHNKLDVWRGRESRGSAWRAMCCCCKLLLSCRLSFFSSLPTESKMIFCKYWIENEKVNFSKYLNSLLIWNFFVFVFVRLEMEPCDWETGENDQDSLSLASTSHNSLHSFRKGSKNNTLAGMDGEGEKQKTKKRRDKRLPYTMHILVVLRISSGLLAFVWFRF